MQSLYLPISIILLTAAIIATMKKSAPCYWVSVVCYALFMIGNAFHFLFASFFGLYMAQSFGPGNVPILSYVMTLLWALPFILPVLLVLPFIPGKPARTIVCAITGVFVSVIFFNFIRLCMRHGSAIPAMGTWNAFLALHHLLLWLRIDELKTAVFPKPREK